MTEKSEGLQSFWQIAIPIFDHPLQTIASQFLFSSFRSAQQNLRDMRNNVVVLLTALLPQLDLAGISLETADVDNILQQIIEVNSLKVWAPLSPKEDDSLVCPAKEYFKYPGSSFIQFLLLHRGIGTFDSWIHRI